MFIITIYYLFNIVKITIEKPAKNMKFFYILLLFFCIELPITAFTDVKPEDEYKAVFIYNFTKYIEWPGNDISDSFEIAIIGESEITIPLKEIAKKKLVNNRKIKIVVYQDVRDINMCHILFISASENKRLHDILQKVKNTNILTISDSMGFAEEGVAFNFVIDDGKLKFEINSNVINKTGLQVSSQLLKLAILVEEKGKSDAEY